MKRTLILTALVVAAWLGSNSVSEAGDWGFRVGFGNHGVSVDFGYGRSSRHYRGHRPYRHVERHVCVRSPVYGRVWVPPAYNTVVVGYDRCGRPICRSVCVSAGYYRSVITGYSCPGCGRHW